MDIPVSASTSRSISGAPNESQINRFGAIGTRNIRNGQNPNWSLRRGETTAPLHGGVYNEAPDFRDNGLVLMLFRNKMFMLNRPLVPECCTVHGDVLRFVCEVCRILICQECGFESHKYHESQTIEQYVVEMDRHYINELNRIEWPKQKIKRSIDLIAHRLQSKKDCIDGEYITYVQRLSPHDADVVVSNAIRLGLVAPQSLQKKTREAIANIWTRFYENISKCLEVLLVELRKNLSAISEVVIEFNQLPHNFNCCQVIRAVKNICDKFDAITGDIPHLQTLLDINIRTFLQAMTDNASHSIELALEFVMLYDEETTRERRGRPLCRQRAEQLPMPMQMMRRQASVPQYGRNEIEMHEMHYGNRHANNVLLPMCHSFGNQHRNESLPISKGFGKCIFNVNYNILLKPNLGAPSVSFGFDGTCDAYLGRPWGVCVDRNNNVIIGDRRNNRIQIFDSDGIFLFGFGEKGSADGQLNLPSGITTDQADRIIVADKDNHRIQIFSCTGEFMLKFGSFGRLPGEFQYPWDVATNSAGNIVVSDTRNHRVQLFSSSGQYIAMFIFDYVYFFKKMPKGHITPRGVCFTPKGDILVTDFENNCVMKLDYKMTKVTCVLGRVGKRMECEFNRPSGLCCDDYGNVLIADSKNQRAMVYNAKFEFQYEVDLSKRVAGSTGASDRPSDVAITPHGQAIIILETAPESKETPRKPFVYLCSLSKKC